jgi:DNA-directed RNA polymerase II subunit RPB1
MDITHTLCNCLTVVCSNDELSIVGNKDATLMFQTHLRTPFVACCVLEQYHLKHEASTWVLREVKTELNQLVVKSSETCGVLAAQSIGEPATQTTLNTSCYTGVSLKSVTLCVLQMKEIISMAAHIKTLSLVEHLKDSISRAQSH